SLGENTMLKSAFKSFYFDIDDKIASIITTDSEGRNLFSFGNVDHSKILGFSLENKLMVDRWRVALGATYLGESTQIDGSTASHGDFLWSFSLQSSLDYTLPKLKTTLSARLKYSGRTQVILEGTDGPLVGQTDDFTWLDASMGTDITKDFNITLGARNIFDLVRVDASDIPSGAHGSTVSTSRLLGNGRSYFIKLLYNLNFN